MMSYVRETHYKRTIEKLKAKLTPQPIETAPKDGTWILIWTPEDFAMGIRLPARWAIGSWSEGGHLPGGWLTDGVLLASEDITHWLPLPTAPEGA